MGKPLGLLSREDAGMCVGGRKPREAGGALSRPVSTLLRARSARMFMLLIMSSRRLCALGKGVWLVSRCGGRKW